MDLVVLVVHTLVEVVADNHDNESDEEDDTYREDGVVEAVVQAVGWDNPVGEDQDNSRAVPQVAFEVLDEEHLEECHTDVSWFFLHVRHHYLLPPLGDVSVYLAVVGHSKGRSCLPLQYTYKANCLEFLNYFNPSPPIPICLTMWRYWKLSLTNSQIRFHATHDFARW